MRRCLRFIVVLSSIANVSTFAQTAPGQVPGPQPRTPTRSPAAPGEQEAAKGTAVIRGFIVALDSGTPLRRAQVRASATEVNENRAAVTDSQGKFEFRDLPAGRYRLSASKSGYVSLQFGQRRPMQGGTPIEVRDKQVLEKVMIALPRGSVIAGRITDEFGEPVAEANVMALRWQRAGGAGRWLPMGPPSRTDDLGQYRLFGLSPGEYLVSATYQGIGMMMMRERIEASSEPTGFAPTYFPGVPSVADATRITVGVAEENTNASFALFATQLVTLEGTVTSSQGTAITQGMVMLRPADNVGVMMFGPGNNGQIDRNGRFRINNVAPGRYVAQANVNFGRGDNDSGEIGRQPVTVGGEKIENVAIVMTPGGRIRGRVITDTGGPLPSGPDLGSGFGPPGLRVFAGSATPFDMSFGPGGNATVDANGTFELRGLVDARLIRVSAGPNWSVKAIMLSGRDHVDTPVEVEPGQTLTGMEIILTNRVSTVAGMVSDSRGQPVLDASIIVFPDDRQFWRFASRYIRTARPDQEGRYRIQGLPPSDAYLVVVVEDMEEGQANDPAYLTTLQPGATRFSLREGDTATVDLKLKQ